MNESNRFMNVSSHPQSVRARLATPPTRTPTATTTFRWTATSLDTMTSLRSAACPPPPPGGLFSEERSCFNSSLWGPWRGRRNQAAPHFCAALPPVGFEWNSSYNRRVWSVRKTAALHPVQLIVKSDDKHVFRWTHFTRIHSEKYFLIRFSRENVQMVSFFSVSCQFFSTPPREDFVNIEMEILFMSNECRTWTEVNFFLIIYIQSELSHSFSTIFFSFSICLSRYGWSMSESKHTFFNNKSAVLANSH